MNNTSNSSNPFADITSTMRPLFSALEKFLIKQAISFEKEVRAAAKESISGRGKFIRPTLTFAAAAGGNYDKNSLVKRGAIVELTHLSTLIHDDVIDNASVRRGSITANKKYGARTAILLGDAIFSQTMILTFEESDNELSMKTAQCVRTICEGEIRQTLADRSKNISKKQYYSMAYGKTGVLFKLACGLGAMTLKNKKWTAAAENVGEELGIAYQIYDDVCDWFMSEKDAGKTLGTDLISGKQTFPLIILLEKLSTKESSLLAKNIGSANQSEILKMMRTLDVASECFKEFSNRISAAEKILKKFPKEGSVLLEFCAVMRKLKFG